MEKIGTDLKKYQMRLAREERKRSKEIEVEFSIEEEEASYKTIQKSLVPGNLVVISSRALMERQHSLSSSLTTLC